MSANTARSWQQQPRPSYYPEPERQAKVKVNKKRWITPGEKALYALFGGIILVVLIFVVSFASSADALNRDVQNLQESVNKQRVQNESLEYKVKELSNPDRIIKIAKENGLKIQNAKVKQANKISN
ncbi:cell division protein FtsL [Aquibacillus sp. 3ASR75-11]|uniref:Cell division protein FtsL n=1 Tax=Terrihalobacillus insolitus TaxID=2950438 RepID=A0A9X4AKV1_9BACI|nr:cell division protein FtsL [Terrihalobacillus insolitus]MDC3412827.1 cell division protein FtsL [Terrihalobacillus insolitus]MDC3423697.1 cell division protein FtsL [Terrihalobacillus insolitus]